MRVWLEEYKARELQCLEPSHEKQSEGDRRKAAEVCSLEGSWGSLRKPVQIDLGIFVVQKLPKSVT